MFNPKTMTSNGYSLWLVPKGEVYRKFFNLIKKLAEECGGPTFELHVTLLGELRISDDEAKSLTKKLVYGQKPFKVTLKSIDFEDYFFRTLFIRVDITNPLLALHNKAKQIFNMDAASYMPHLSILYGNYPKDLKEKIIAEIGRDQSAEFEVNSVHLVKGGEVKNWQIIKEFTFS